MRSDVEYMRIALEQAQLAYSHGEVPIGAIVVSEDRIIAKGYNLTERLKDVTAHAEMQAITSAANFLGGKYLTGCTLYVTLEPCPMCAAALNWSQISRIVFGAADTKRGFQRYTPWLLHPKTEVIGDVLADECGALISRFFEKRR